MAAHDIIMAAGGASTPATYIEDVFSTYLYSGNSTTNAISNGIDLSTKGGMVWLKCRSDPKSHALFDTARGAGNSTSLLMSNATYAAASENAFKSFDASGFTLQGSPTNVEINTTGQTYASWTFRKQPKFFDVVTFTTPSSGNLVVNHSLGSTPGMIVIKSTSATDNWIVYHRYDNFQKYFYLNSTAAAGSGYPLSSATNTTVTVTVNVNTTPNTTYVMYLFAHDAGGFGLTGTDNVISCGSFTTTSNSATVNLGWEPQFLLIKGATDAPGWGAGDWAIFDNMRGMSTVINGSTTSARLLANTSGAEVASTDYQAAYATPSSTGFQFKWSVAGTGQQYIYIAIRRGPMKVPTDGTKVFNPKARAGTGTATSVTGIGFNTDSLWIADRSGYNALRVDFDRLRGNYMRLALNDTGAEQDDTSGPYGAAVAGVNDGTYLLQSNGYVNGSGYNYINYAFKRAPNFFDEVCYTGNATNRTINHNLGVVPELIIVKDRTNATYDWFVYESGLTSAAYILRLNTTLAQASTPSVWNSTAPTSTVFSVGTAAGVNASGDTYVAYLFATCAGVSKVGSYTGNGTTQTINCGFAAGARFVMIKRTDSTGDWYVWDTARGIISANDPHLSLNTTAAEVTTDDSIDPDSTGFIVNQLAATNINVNAATYIFLAIS